MAPIFSFSFKRIRRVRKKDILSGGGRERHAVDTARLSQLGRVRNKDILSGGGRERHAVDGHGSSQGSVSLPGHRFVHPQDSLCSGGETHRKLIDNSRVPVLRTLYRTSDPLDLNEGFTISGEWCSQVRARRFELHQT